jgi:hypothetical protein
LITYESDESAGGFGGLQNEASLLTMRRPKKLN